MPDPPFSSSNKEHWNSRESSYKFIKGLCKVRSAVSSRRRSSRFISLGWSLESVVITRARDTRLFCPRILPMKRRSRDSQRLAAPNIAFPLLSSKVPPVFLSRLEDICADNNSNKAGIKKSTTKVMFPACVPRNCAKLSSLATDNSLNVKLNVPRSE